MTHAQWAAMTPEQQAAYWAQWQQWEAYYAAQGGAAGAQGAAGYAYGQPGASTAVRLHTLPASSPFSADGAAPQPVPPGRIARVHSRSGCMEPCGPPA